MNDNPAQKPIISAIAAMSRDTNLIGTSDGKIPWHIKEDFAYFKEKTFGHPIIMGRKTFETFKKPLPGRVHIVISRTAEKESFDEQVIWVTSIEDALSKAREIEDEEIFIIGGGQIYELTLNYIDRLYVTYVDGNFEGDIFFPNFIDKNFKKVSSKYSSEGEYTYEFAVFEK